MIACDGARSPVRSMMGLEFGGRAFEERFLISDVEMKADFPSERWFWFEPPFHSGQSALLHKQPDDIWRIDLQLGPDADPEEEKKPENVLPRIEKMLGHRDFELDWVSVYSFQCRRLDRFVHGRVVFAGDSAHVVSPFGARGGNGGIQDIDNLVWKLAAVIRDEADESLIETYDEERTHGADENILNSARATSFMTPKSEMERIFRDQVLDLAETHDFARRLVNSGRLSKPCSLENMSLQTPCDETGGVAPGMVMPDAPVRGERGAWLLNHFGDGFAVMAVGCNVPDGLPDSLGVFLAGADAAREGGGKHLEDHEGIVAQRYRAGSIYLDQAGPARCRPFCGRCFGAGNRGRAQAREHERDRSSFMIPNNGDVGADRLGTSGDDFYALLMQAHEGLSFEQSARLNARLVLLLANRVGDLKTLKPILEAAEGTSA